jgi:hypothetical protein
MDEDLQKKESWGKVALQALKYLALGLAAVFVMLLVGGVLLVGFVVYACGHH